LKMPLPPRTHQVLDSSALKNLQIVDRKDNAATGD
jgi:hypothetical protein